jgi:hypothetical protein
VRARREVVIGPDEDQASDAEAEHEELAAERRLVAGWFVGVGGWWLVAGGWFGGHRTSIQYSFGGALLRQRVEGELCHGKVLAIVRYQYQIMG